MFKGCCYKSSWPIICVKSKHGCSSGMMSWTQIPFIFYTNLKYHTLLCVFQTKLVWPCVKSLINYKQTRFKWFSHPYPANIGPSHFWGGPKSFLPTKNNSREIYFHTRNEARLASRSRLLIPCHRRLLKRVLHKHNLGWVGFSVC